jgi:hypothetical protein
MRLKRLPTTDRPLITRRVIILPFSGFGAAWSTKIGFFAQKIGKIGLLKYNYSGSMQLNLADSHIARAG